ncbi:PAS domain S-box protein [Methanococcoides orientis]|uniref:PAS domain-containing sensor histidine kinase n=1 Tax=Methanococcoides orientis TaxID=2822137 RepID=UPI001E313579|nr:PAS domain S-box protein [Methanococcoides orientis]UGV40782.1 PAS domain S-box protein [Methanococcoides orientis]
MEKHFETIFNSVNDGILICSLEGHFLEVNQITCDELGYQRDELLQMTAMDITPPEFREMAGELIVEKMNQGGGFVETIGKRKDGSLAPFELNIRPIEYKGNPAILAVARNITERKQMEESLRKSEASLSNAQRIAKIGNWDWDIVNNEVYASDEIYRIFGLTRVESKSAYNALLNCVHPDDRMFVQDNVNKAIYENKPYSIDYRILLSDGSVTIVHSQGEVIFNETGQAIRMVGTVQDITESKKVETLLRESEEQYRTLFKAIPIGVGLTDLAGNIIAFNDAMLSPGGYTQKDIQNIRSVAELYYDINERNNALAIAQKQGILHNHEVQMKRKDGSPYDTLLNLIPVEIKGQQCWQATVEDITERKKAEEAMLNSKLAAEATNQAKTEFIANMSHELRTPLNSIIGFSDILSNDNFNNLNDTQKIYLANINASGKHLLGIINDILDLSKIEAGKMELIPEKFDIRDAINEIKMTMTSLATKKEIKLKCNLNIGNPLIVADSAKFRQILYNLLSNAIKFTDKGGSVTIGVNTSNEQVSVFVEDNGIGISPNEQEKLFDSFSQVDSSTSREYTGTGLGLALVKYFVEMHAGEVWVESEPGKGSTFGFSIPIDPESTSY